MRPLLAFLAFLVAVSPPADRALAELLPTPAEIRLHPGQLELSAAWTVRPSGEPEDSTALSLLIDEAERTHGWRWAFERHPQARQVVLRPAGRSNTGDTMWETQGYDLILARDSIVIAAPSVAGRFYGVQTLRQLMRGGRVLPAGRLHDRPALRWRGVSQDISRGQMPRMAEFRRTLADLAFLKLNMYHLYIEDVLEFPSAPNVGRGRDRLGAAELRALTDEARRLQITLVPIVQSVSHQERLLSMPGHERYAEIQDVGRQPWTATTLGPKLQAIAKAIFLGNENDETPKPQTFAVGSPETRAFVCGLLRDAAQAAPSAYLHLGADEAVDIGSGVGKSEAARSGKAALLASYLAHLAGFVDHDLERRPLIYADALLADPDLLRQAPKNMGLVHWNYGAGRSDTAIRVLRQAGFDEVFVSPGLWNWKATYPHYWRAFPNIAVQTDDAVRTGAAGLIVSSWGDNGSESMAVHNWPGYAYAADAAWRGTSDAPEEFLRRFAGVHYGVRDPAIARVEFLLGWQEFQSIGWNQRLVHRPVTIRPRSDAWTIRMQALENDMKTASRLLERARHDVRFHREDLAYLEHAIRRFDFAARREITLDRIARVPGSQDRSDLERLRDEAIALANEYVALWRARYRPMGVKYIERRWREQIGALTALCVGHHLGGEPTAAAAN